MLNKKIVFIVFFLILMTSFVICVYHNTIPLQNNQLSSSQLNQNAKPETSLAYKLNAAKVTKDEMDSKMFSSKYIIEKELQEKHIDFSSVDINEDIITINLIRQEDIDQAAETIEEITVLTFKEEMSETEKEEVRQQFREFDGMELNDKDLEMLFYKETGLDGRHIENAEVYFNPDICQGALYNFLELDGMESSNNLVDCPPQVIIYFNEDGKKIFSDLTSRNVNKKIAVFINDSPISIPRVTEPITDGKAIIDGNFSYENAKNLAEKFRSGVLAASLTPIK
ncbi:MAG: hypothetical protein PHI66_03600 [Candidatus Pacebacteria bacterium]|nr:hypothetical protein [Candidatus Paceibacterota bacterium]